MAARSVASTPRAKVLHHHAGPFPPIALSDDDKQVLREVTYGFLREGVHEFEQYVQHPTLSAQDWTLQREKDGMLVFHRDADPADPNSLPTLLGVGTVPGPLADPLYGVSAMTPEQGRQRDKYMSEMATDFVTLVTLEEPTAQDPFRTMHVSWLVKQVPMPIGAFLKNSDSVCIEATGLTQFESTGERVGYSLMHSVALPECPALKTHTRVDVSLLTLWREHSRTRAEIYLRVFMDLKHIKTAKLALRSFVGDMLYFANYSNVGQHRKLAWMLQRHPRDQDMSSFRSGVSHDSRHALNSSVSTNSSHSSSAHSSGSGGSTRSSACQFCGKRSEGVFARQHKALCALCRDPVCSSCTVKKTVLTAVSAKMVHKHLARLCPSCWDHVVHVDTEKIAAEERLEMLNTNRQRRDMLPLLRAQSAGSVQSAGSA